jgi:ABC-type glycerol-3-phosphate transport system substrate-binding protein
MDQLDGIAYSAMSGSPILILSLPGGGAGGDDGGSLYLFGLNRRSRNVTMGWEFLKLLVSEEIPRSSVLAGLPLNNGVFQKQLQNYRRLAAKGELSYMSSGVRKYKVSQLSDEQVDMVTRVISRITRIDSPDRRLSQIVSQELRRFFDGHETAEQASKSLQDKVNTYLNE